MITAKGKALILIFYDRYCNGELTRYQYDRHVAHIMHHQDIPTRNAVRARERGGLHAATHKAGSNDNRPQGHR